MEQIDMFKPDRSYIPFKSMTEDEWVDKLQPIPNPYTLGTGFDYGQGSCLMGHTDLTKYMTENALGWEYIWTIIDNDEYDPEEDEDAPHAWLSHGYHYVNILGYIVCKFAPPFPVTEDIPCI